MIRQMMCVAPSVQMLALLTLNQNNSVPAVPLNALCSDVEFTLAFGPDPLKYELYPPSPMPGCSRVVALPEYDPLRSALTRALTPVSARLSPIGHTSIGAAASSFLMYGVKGLAISFACPAS